MMKTVGDFKKAGLVFVDDDVISAHTDNHGRMEKIGISYVEDVNEDLGRWWGDSLVGEFSWRDNTGVKPEFDGAIDWERDDGVVLDTCMLDLNWNGSIIKWRPRIAESIPTETPEEKEALDRIDELESIGSIPDDVYYRGVKARVLTGMKHDQDKPMYNLLPANAIESLAKVLTFGAKKYAPNSWQDVEDGLERYRAALLRHAFAIQRGELLDEESGLPHSAHIMANAAFILELQLANGDLE